MNLIVFLDAAMQKFQKFSMYQVAELQNLRDTTEWCSYSMLPGISTGLHQNKDRKWKLK